VRTLKRPEFREFLPYPRERQRLPGILSKEEVARLINASGNLFRRTLLMVLYATGMRRAEVARLKIGDIDSQRMILRIEQGKGSKDRYAMLSPALLTRLRGWWRVAHAQGKMLPGGWLFPGQNPVDPVTTRQLNRAIHVAAEAARIDKHPSETLVNIAGSCGHHPSETSVTFRRNTQ
jgi:integrase